ncbi:hypothetical protein GCM10025779_24590 [Arthrobacter cryoconiti]
MTPAQQFAGAADILTSRRNKVDKGTGMPPDSPNQGISGPTTGYCLIPSRTLTDATYAIHMDGRKYRP